MIIKDGDGNILIEIRDLSRLLHVTPQAIYDVITRKRIPVIARVEEGKRRYRVPATPLTYWLDERMTGVQKRLSLLQAAKNRVSVLGGGNVLIEIRDVAKLLDITTQSVYGIISRKRMPVTTRIEEGKNRHRVPAALLIQWLDERIAGQQKRLSTLQNAKTRIMELLNYVSVR